MGLVPNKSSIQAAIAKRRARRPVRLVARVCEKYLNAYHNLSYDMERNGEINVIEELGLSDGVVFDVGANRGEWTRLVKDRYPETQIHSFEIDPVMVPVLRDNVSHLDGVTVVAVGLADSAGTVTINSYPDASVVTSIFDYPHPGERVAKEVEVSTGDGYAEETGIDKIDFLKIDTEGAEMLVLRGFERMLKERRIRAIQFEYGWINIKAKVFLQDLYEFLEARQYRIGKIYPHGVDFRAYDVHDEDFRGPNYLAVAADEVDLIGRVSVKS